MSRPAPRHTARPVRFARRSVVYAAGALLAGTVLAAAGAAGAEGELVAAVGVSTRRDPLAAAEAATKSMLAKFRARRRRPGVVLFLDRTGPHAAGDGAKVGRAVRDLAAAATFGTGGATGPAGVSWWAKRDFEPTFLVCGLAADGLRARAHLAPGPDPAGGPALPRRAEALAARAGAGRLALAFAALGPRRGGAFLSALRRALPAEMPLVGLAAAKGDYIYSSAQTPGRTADRPAAPRELLLVLDGPFTAALADAASRNPADPDAVAAETHQAAAALRRRLAGRAPALLLAFSDPGRMRTSGLDAPGKELRILRDSLGPAVSVFGCYAACPAGAGADGRFTVGPGRIVLAALADAAEADSRQEARP